MPDHHQIVDDIRAFLGASDRENTPELAGWAAAYAQLCKTANERLRKCADRLHRGLRSEAIHLAEAEPDLLELVGALDFPEQSNWAEICMMYGLLRPLQLMLDAAAELNEAYAAAEPTAALLARHRLLALARSPLTERIDIMRQLAEVDVANPIWPADIATFETARVRDLRSEASAAVREKDIARATKLLNEANDKRWLAPPPEDFKRSLSAALKQLTQAVALTRLREIVPELNDAYAAMSYDECRTILARWNAFTTSAGLNTLPADLAAQVQPVVDWMAGQDARRAREKQYQSSCAGLNTAIESDAPTVELQRLYEAIKRFEMPVPQDLERRMVHKVQTRSLAAKRRVRRNIALVVTGLVAVAIGTGYLLYQGAQKRESQRWAGEIQHRLEKYDFEGANESWRALSQEAPRIAQRAELVDLKRRVDESAAKDRARAAEFRTVMDQAKAAGFDNVNEASVNQLQSLARAAEEQAELSEFKLRAEARETELQGQRDEAFAKDVAVLGSDAKLLDSILLEKDPTKFAFTLSTLEERANQLGTRDGIGVVGKSSLRSVQQRLAALRADYAKVAAQTAANERETKAIQQITAGRRSAQQLSEALTEFVKAYPQSNRSREFNEAARSSSGWIAVEEWSALVTSWSGRLTPAGQKDISERISAIDAYTAKYPTAPFAPSAQRYKTFLVQARQALDANGPWRGSLRAILGSPLVRNVKSLRTKDGKVYYMLGDAKYTEDVKFGITFPAVISNDVAHPKRIRIQPDQIATKPAPSAQSALSQNVAAKLDAISVANWDVFGVEVADAIARQPEMDAVLRVILLERALRLNQKGSWGIDEIAGDAIEEAITNLSSLKADDIAWMNPDDADAATARETATSILKRVPPITELKGKVVAARNAMFDELEFRPVATGVAMKDGDRWRIGGIEKPTDGQVAFVVAPSPSGAAALRAIAKASAGAFVVDASTMRGIPQGSMVFVRNQSR